MPKWLLAEHELCCGGVVSPLSKRLKKEYPNRTKEEIHFGLNLKSLFFKIMMRYLALV